MEQRSRPSPPGSDTLVLGIETSCDETAAAVVARAPDGTGRILSNVIRAQWEEHRRYGGVVPEIAARAHVECLDEIVALALREAGAELGDLDAIAVTAGPGLIGGLLVGVTTAEALALVHRLPLVPINHLEAHALTVGLTEGLRPPYLLLLVSGGHTQLLIVHGVGRYERLGTTIDDARARPSTRPPSCWGWASPAVPRSSGPRPPAGRAASPCRARCWAGPSRTSPSPASRRRSAARRRPWPRSATATSPTCAPNSSRRCARASPTGYAALLTSPTPASAGARAAW